MSVDLLWQTWDATTRTCWWIRCAMLLAQLWLPPAGARRTLCPPPCLWKVRLSPKQGHTAVIDPWRHVFAQGCYDWCQARFACRGTRRLGAGFTTLLLCRQKTHCLTFTKTLPTISQHFSQQPQEGWREDGFTVIAEAGHCASSGVHRFAFATALFSVGGFVSPEFPALQRTRGWLGFFCTT